jgi:hypothetical protein
MKYNNMCSMPLILRSVCIFTRPLSRQFMWKNIFFWHVIVCRLKEISRVPTAFIVSLDDSTQYFHNTDKFLPDCTASHHKSQYSHCRNSENLKSRSECPDMCSWEAGELCHGNWWIPLLHYSDYTLQYLHCNGGVRQHDAEENVLLSKCEIM